MTPTTAPAPVRRMGSASPAAAAHDDAHRDSPNPHFSDPRVHHPTIASSTLLVGAVWGLLVVAPHLQRAMSTPALDGTGLGWTVIAVAAALLALVVFVARRVLFATITSLPFSIAMLGSLLVATMVGTLVLQNAEPAQYLARYGESGTRVVRGLQLDDLFHSTWFRGLVALMALSLSLLCVRNKVWRTAMWGHGLAHGGVVVILIGGLIGGIGGAKGFIDLHEGQTASSMVRTDGAAERVLPLGFSVTLEEFDVDHYDDAWRLFLYQPGDSGEWQVKRAFQLGETDDWTAVGGGELVRVVAAWPDYELRRELRVSADGTGRPGLELTLGADSRPSVLLAGASGDAGLSLPDGSRLRLVDTSDELQRLIAAPAGDGARHVVRLADGSELDVEPGGTYPLPQGARLHVMDALPDFTYDIASKSARSASDEPRNPALEVAILRDGQDPETRWLFAKMPDYGSQHGQAADALPLVYVRENALTLGAHERVAVAADGLVRELRDGRVVDTRPLAEAFDGLPVRDARLLPSAVEVTVPGTRSERWDRPVVELEHRVGGGPVQRVSISADHTRPEGVVELADGNSVLVLDKRGDDVKSFTSRLAVTVDGEKVHEALVRVNEPLTWGGFMFYQSNYRPEDPTYSGFLVMRDPGLPVVFTGFALMVAGMLFIAYVRPRILARRYS
ncbi:MAG: cytochrome c biogenesis protein ResB [Planctomycetes bacterium]|nr:cytochrome c biogenesis protein ResB [Planctomycetota bacterium]